MKLHTTMPILLGTLALSACIDTDLPTNDPQPMQANVGFNLLTGADITLARFNNGQFDTLETTRSTDSGNYAAQGTFSFDVTSLDDNTWYLLSATGGQEKDVDLDGILDTSSTENQGTLHTLSKGAWLKAQCGAHISLATELAYQAVKSALSTSIDNDTLTGELDDQAIKLLGDSSMTAADLLAFDPKSDYLTLDPTVRQRFESAQQFILNGSSANLAFLPTLGYQTIGTDDEYESVMSADGSEIYTIEGKNIIITHLDTLARETISGDSVTGSDSEYLTYNPTDNKLYTSNRFGGLNSYDITSRSYDGIILEAYTANDSVYCAQTSTLFVASDDNLYAWNTTDSTLQTYALAGDSDAIDSNADCSELYLMQNDTVVVFATGTSTIANTYALSEEALKAISSADNSELYLATGDGFTVINRTDGSTSVYASPDEMDVYDITPSKHADQYYAISEQHVFLFDVTTKTYTSDTPVINNPNEEYSYNGLYIADKDQLILSYPTRIANIYSGRDITVKSIDVAEGSIENLLVNHDQTHLYFKSNKNELFEYSLANETIRQTTIASRYYNFVEDIDNNQLIAPSKTDGVDFIDTDTLAVNNNATDELAGESRSIEIAANQGLFFLGKNDTDSIDIFDTATQTFIERINDTCDHTWGVKLEYAEALNTLFYSCNSYQRVHAYHVVNKTNEEYDLLHTGSALTYNAEENRLYIGGYQEFTVIDLDTNTYITQQRSRTIFTVTPFDGTDWVLTGGNNGIFANNLVTQASVQLYVDFANKFEIVGDDLYLGGSGNGVVQLDLSDLR